MKRTIDRLERGLYAIWDELPLLFIVARMDGQVVRVNKYFETVLGWKLDDLAGRTWDAFLHPDDLARVKATTARRGRPREAEHNFVTRWLTTAGTYVAISWFRPSHDGKSDRVYAVGRPVFTP